MKYGIKGKTTVARWVRQYGNGTRGKVIRVERPGEINEVTRLTARVRRLEGALADANIDAALERAYTRIACRRRRGSRTWRSLKKSRWPAGHEAVEAGRPEVWGERQRSVPPGGDHPAKIITRDARRAAPRGGGRAVVALVPRKGRFSAPSQLSPEAADVSQRRSGPGRRELGAGPVCGGVAGQRPAVGTQAAEYPCTTNSHHCLPVFTNRIRG